MMFYFLMFCIPFVVILVLGEITLLVLQSDKTNHLILDDILGWKTPDHSHFITRQTDKAGVEYEVDFSTAQHGFRLYGDVESQKQKILFIGDSYTHAIDVSDHKTYFALIQQQLDVEVFAYGCGGYSSLQEYMILDLYLDQIKPDIVIWQFTSNDFINNDFELEFASYRNNNSMRRPYLDDKLHVIYRTPKRFGIFRNWINHNSKFLYFICSRMDRIQSSIINLELEIDHQQAKHAGFKTAWAKTYAIMQKVKERCRTIPVYAFSVDLNEPYHSEIQHICELTNIDFIYGVPESLQTSVEATINIYAADGFHWNETGHNICATMLIKHLEKQWQQNL